jgi:hypothetical protein
MLNASVMAIIDAKKKNYLANIEKSGFRVAAQTIKEEKIG